MSRAMRIALAACAVGSFVAWVAIVPEASPPAQPSTSPAEFIAFRVDDERVVATIKVLNDISKRSGPGPVSPHPPARYGFPHFEPWPELLERVPSEIRSTAAWVLHVGAGRSMRATTEHVVGGNAQCQDAVGMLLRIAPEDATAFAAVSARYYIAHAGANAPVPAASAVARSVSGAISAAERKTIEGVLDGLLQRELPKVRSERDAMLDRMAQSTEPSSRRAAAERRRIDAEVATGRARLTYDVQTFRLGPDDALQHFVRAEWRVNGRLGFAGSVWLRGDPQFTIVEQDVKPAGWLRMLEFQGELHRPHLGLVLNVFDRDGDGWGEILFVQEGYEGFGMQVLEYGPAGLERTGVGYGAGC